MVLADSSVWITHFRCGDLRLATLLTTNQVVMHPFVLGEISLGNLAGRDQVLDALSNLPEAATAFEDEVQTFIAAHRLFGQGIGYIDVHLLAAAKLSPGTKLWTLDKHLAAVANSQNLDWRG